MSNENDLVSNELNPRIFMDIETTDLTGRIIMELYKDKAPKSVKNFKQLCTGESGFSYLGSLIHRIIAPEFIIQGGDITENNGTGGKSIYGKPFENENLGWNPMTDIGLLCMANEGPDTISNTSQFFITLCPTPWLSNQTTVFGKVIFGIQSLLDLQKVPINALDFALDEVRVNRCGELRLAKNEGIGIQEKSNVTTQREKPRNALISKSDGRSELDSDLKRPELVDRYSNRNHCRTKTDTTSRLTEPVILKGRGTMKYRDKRTRY